MLSGYVHPKFAPVAEELRRALGYGKGGAEAGGGAVAIYHRGELVADIWGGKRSLDGADWERETVALSFSTTKGVVATVVHRLVDQGLLDVHSSVADYWPEFGTADKAEMKVRHLLDHSAGMHSLRGVVDDAFGLLDWKATTEALADASPAWRPGSRHGYHGITFGFLVGEVIKRVTGLTVNEAVQREVVEPLGLESMSIGWPAARRSERADLIIRRSPTERFEPRLGMLRRLGVLKPTVEAFVVPGFTELIESEDVYAAELPALNGCFTARSLAGMYSVLADGGVGPKGGYLSSETLKNATTIQELKLRPDAVVGFPMRWRLGYHMAATNRGILPGGFGHFGFGGSGAWADPLHELSVAFTCNRVAGTPFADMRMLRIGAAAVRCASRK